MELWADLKVSFPNCWDTVNAYKSDNSHVAYGEGDYMYGKCPPGFKRIPTLFLESKLTFRSDPVHQLTLQPYTSQL
jgi:hypothetical protein